MRDPERVLRRNKPLMDQISSTVSKTNGIAAACERIVAAKTDLHELARDPHVSLPEFVEAAKNFDRLLRSVIRYVEGNLERYRVNVRTLRSVLRSHRGARQ